MKVHKTETPRLHLDEKYVARGVEDLNHLLASFQVFYQNLRGFHWNIKGPHFFELHREFQEMYEKAATDIDEVAERILTLGYVPLHTYSDFLANSDIKEMSGIIPAEEMVYAAAEGIKALLKVERYLLIESAKVEDEGTNALMSDLLSYHEKKLWMLEAFLKK